MGQAFIWKDKIGSTRNKKEIYKVVKIRCLIMDLKYDLVILFMLMLGSEASNIFSSIWVLDRLWSRQHNMFMILKSHAVQYPVL